MRTRRRGGSGPPPPWSRSCHRRSRSREGARRGDGTSRRPLARRAGARACRWSSYVRHRIRAALIQTVTAEPCNVGPRMETKDRDDDTALLAALRAGDERAFATLVDRYQASLVRVARQYVPTQEIAEDVAQEAWLGLLRGLDSFEGRSSLRTYLFRIVMNLARTRGVREARTAPFSSLARDGDEDGPSVDPER